MRPILCVIFVSFCTCVFGQKEVSETTGWSFRDRGYFGLGFGGLGLGTDSQFGNYFSIGVSPQIGYMLTKNLSTGIGFEYQYTNYSDLKINHSFYGGYPFLRYNIKFVFLQVDYDFYSVKNNFLDPNSDRGIYERFFAGIGYSVSSGRSALNVLVSYDLLFDSQSRFASPLSIRIFYTF